MSLDLSAINKAFKSIEKGNEEAVIDLATLGKIPRVKSRSAELNKVLGGGTPKGRIIELFGEESNGKSLLTNVIARDFQDDGEFVVLFDFEHSFDEEFANKQGLRTTPDVFKLVQPDTITEGFEMMEVLIEAGVGLCITDSVASAPTKQELDGDFDKAHMGVKARQMSQGLLKITPVIHKHGCTAIFVNQTRKDLTVTYGDNTTTPGGKALKFYASIRIKVRRREYFNQGDEPIGFKMQIRTVKNKTSAPNKTCELDFYYETGLDTMGGTIDLLCEKEVIIKGGGGNFRFIDLAQEEVKIRGQQNLIEYLKENEEVFSYLISQLEEDPEEPVKEIS